MLEFHDRTPGAPSHISRENAHRRSVHALALALAACTLFPDVAAADAFCDALTAISAQAPAFKSLEGEPFNAADFVGTVSIPDTSQCIVRHDDEFDANFQRTGKDDIHYECLWDNGSPARLDWLKHEVTACFPDATYVDGVEYGTGGTYASGSVTVKVDLATLTQQLWATVRGK